MTIVVEYNGENVEFPDMETAQAFFASQGGQAPAQPERGFGAMLYDNVIGNPDDGMESYGEQLGTWLNRAGETMTLGTVGDEAAAAMTGILPGRTYDSELERYRANEEEMGTAGRITADVAGAITGGVAAPIGFLGQGANMASRLAVGGLAGGAMGGLYGFMEGEGNAEERTEEMGQGAAFGAGAGLAAPLLGGIVRRVGDRIVGNRAINEAAANAPSTDELRAAGQAAYQQIDDAGVRIRPDAVRRTLDDITANLDQGGTRYATASQVLPQATAVRNALPEVAEGANTVPFDELDQLRRYIGAASANADNAASRGAGSANDTRLVNEAFGSVDDFVRNMTEADIDAGDLATLQDVLPRARDLWARMSRSQLVDDGIEAADGYVSGPTSGLRNQFRRIVNNPRLSRGFSDAELALMRRVAQGSIPERLLYNLGGGLGQLAAPITGAAVGSTGGLAGMVGGAALGGAISAGTNSAAEAVARRNAEIARAVIANGRLPAQLPVANDATRQIVEQLMMRGGATVGAQ